MKYRSLASSLWPPRVFKPTALLHVPPQSIIESLDFNQVQHLATEESASNTEQLQPLHQPKIRLHDSNLNMPDILTKALPQSIQVTLQGELIWRAYWKSRPHR